MKTWELLKNNPHLFQRYFIKEYIIKACRRFFEKRNYHELESPILTSALPQERYINILDVQINSKNNKNIEAYIIPTTETFNKKILAAGLGQHFVITKVARGLEEIGVNHSPEFTMLEWYHLNADYFDLMNDCEELLIYINNFIYKSLVKEKSLGKFMVDLSTFNPKGINYQDQYIDLTPPWDRVSVPEALLKYCNINLEDIQNLNNLKRIAQNKGYKITDQDDWQIIFELIFASEIEINFSKTKPTFVYNYPKILGPLTKVNQNNPLVCEKVELYIANKEIANGYTELIDGNIQEENFLKENKARKEMGMKDIKIDFDMIDAIKSGLPDVAGIGMGLDRLAMIFANAKNIAEINYFPSTEWFE